MSSRGKSRPQLLLVDDDPDHARKVVREIRGKLPGVKISKFTGLDELMEALGAGEELFKLIAETATDAIVSIDENSRILFANPAVEQILGYTADEIVGSPLTSLMPERLRPMHLESLKRYRQTGRKNIPWQRVSLPGLHKEGHEVPLEISFGEFVKEGKRAFTGILRDISERKQAEEALAEKARLAAFTEEVSLALVRPEPLGASLRVCAEAMVRHLDAALARIWTLRKGENVLELQASAGLSSRLDGSYSRMPVGTQKVGTIAESRNPYLSNDLIGDPGIADQAWVKREGLTAFAGYPLIVEDHLVGVMAMFARKPLTQSTTQAMASVANALAVGINRKQVEEQLVRSEAGYRLLFESNPLPVWAFDRETLEFLAVNNAAIKHYDYSREEFLSMKITDIRPPEDIPRLLEDISEPHLGLDKAGVWRHRKKDGSLIEVEITSHPILFEGRRAELVLALDVTHRRRLEEQLRQAQKMEAVGRLAGGVAHDFNNVLTVITGYSDLLLAQLSEHDAQFKALSEIRKAADRAASLTRQLLAFSRKQVLEPEVLDLNAVAANIEKMLHRLIGEDIELVTALTPGLGRVKADAGQIEQVILNLVINARDAMPLGGKLTLETENVDLDEQYVRGHLFVQPGSYVMISVSDNGTGMDKETMSHIFEPFFTTKEKGKGTGLGLSTVYGIVKQSGGYIMVYSEVGKGTTFKIYLPRVKEAVRARIREKAKKAVAPTRSETVLLAEDDPIVRQVTREILETSGYVVLEAANGAEAVALCESHHGPIHLMLTDVVMPEMSGRELARHLEAVRPEMKVLYFSGYAENAIVHHGVLDPGIAFLQKPFTPGALLEKIRQVLGET